MSQRLIDANALQNLLIPIAISLEHEYGSLGGAVSGVMKHIDNMPAIDAVPVVRCRDCKHMILQSNMKYCTVWHGPNGMGDDGFCNYGERKEGAEND